MKSLAHGGGAQEKSAEESIGEYCGKGECLGKKQVWPLTQFFSVSFL